MPALAQHILLIVAAALLALAAALSIIRAAKPKQGLRITAKGSSHVGIALGLIALIWHCASQGRWIPLEDNFAALATMGLLLSMFVVYIQRFRPIGGLDWFLLPIAVLLLTGAVVFGTLRPDAYRLDNAWYRVHLISTFGGVAAFAISAAVGFIYLLASARLRSKTLPPAVAATSLERLENVTQLAVTWGFALLTVGLLTGTAILFHQRQQSGRAPWITDTKIVLAAAAWVIYGLALHTPISSGLRGRKAALLSIIGFVLVLGAVIVVQFAKSSQ